MYIPDRGLGFAGHDVQKTPIVKSDKNLRQDLGSGIVKYINHTCLADLL